MKTKPIGAFALVLCALLLAGEAAMASASQSLPAASEEYRVHDQRKAEGMAASRSVRNLPRDTTNGAGIEQIPIDTSKNVAMAKDPATPPSDPTSRRAAAVPPPSGPPPCPYLTSSAVKTASLVKVFPEVSWHVCVRDMGLKGLWVGPVQLRRSPSAAWTTVLFQAGLAEIFVPYESGSFRPYDLQYCPSGGCALDVVTAQDRGPTGTLVQLTNEPAGYTVVSETRDRGVAWLCKQSSQSVRRSQELLVWAVIDGGNYDNIVQYGFRDDGTMTFRVGNTGYNNPSRPLEAHTHNALWRVDMDLNGFPGDSAYLLQHSEPNPSALQATDLKSAFDSNTEGGATWEPERFTSLLIEDNASNAFGDRLGYEFTPAQLPTSRHFGPDDDWTRNDVYVTDYHSNEQGWTTVFQPPDDYLLPQTANNEVVTNRDLVAWVKSSAHHHPIDEDRSANDLSSPANVTGVTLAHWSGFDVTPHNLFTANPLGAPVRCGN